MQALTLARLMLAQGHVEEASRLLARVVEQASQLGRSGYLIEGLVLQGRVAQARAELDTALSHLGAALGLAAPEGYARAFLDEGAPVASLLREARSRHTPGLLRAAAHGILRRSSPLRETGLAPSGALFRRPAPPITNPPCDEAR